jgi:hypothetical protein
MSCLRGHALSLVKKSQNQAILWVILDMCRMWSIVPRPERTPFAGGFPLTASQVNNDLVVRERGGDIKNIYK